MVKSPGSYARYVLAFSKPLARADSSELISDQSISSINSNGCRVMGSEG